MKKLKSLAKQTPAYSVLMYYRQWRLLRVSSRRLRHWTQEDQDRLDFYAQFLQAEDIVFDVGANMGNRTKVFARLGTHVIAVEPQPDCARVLESFARHQKRVSVVQKVVSSRSGVLTMHCSTAHTLSSCSDQWITRVTNSGRFPGHRWDRDISAHATTMDALIGIFGDPKFVKIDTEGHESDVLQGLSRPVAALSFEFTPEFPEGTDRCLERISLLMDAEFQLCLGERAAFHLPQWVNRVGLSLAMQELGPRAQGDVYARRLASSWSHALASK